MHRQKSILSFLKKPLPKDPELKLSSNQDPNPNQNQPSDLDLEIRGTDTPPEKILRPIVPANSPVISGEGRRRVGTPFSSILHKFQRNERSGGGNKRYRDDNTILSTQLIFDELDENHENVKKHTPAKDGSKTGVSKFSDDYNGDLPNFELFPDIMGPETPAMRPLVPGLKRVQKDCCSAETKHESSSFVLGKRAKCIQSPVVGETTRGEVLENPCSKFEWLNPSTIRDADGRRPSDPLYDKRTLYIPPDALKKMTATQKQYWSVKRQYMDVVLFFKVGKFYELYELDAEIGQKELDWKMTVSGVGKCRQVGISESGIDDAVQKLNARGYKVGRMEQLETSGQAKARGADSVIERKLVHVFTPSTTTDNIGPNAVHLLTLKEGMENGSPIYGFAFLDYAALKFSVGSISDDDSLAALGALLMQVSPREIVYEISGISKEAHKALIKYASSGSIAMQLTPVIRSTDFQDPFEVRHLIHSKGYFSRSSNSWTSAFDGTDHQDLVICALGGLAGHLSRLKLEDALRNGELLPYHVYKSCLRMDGQTLVNLEIFSNNADGGQSGTLYKYLDHCITLSGKRLLRMWICHPLKDIDEINDRLNAVEGLMKEHGVVSIITGNLRRLPDLERLLGRVKATVGSSCTLILPFIGEKILKQRIKAFGTLVKGLRIGMDLLLILVKNDSSSLPISKVINLPKLSELNELLKQCEVAVDDDFPHYQDHEIGDSDADTLSVLVELFVEKSIEWSHVISALDRIDVLQSFAATAVASCGSICRPVLLPADSRSAISKGPMLRLKGLWHPYAVGENGNSLVPNDIYLGEGTSESHPRALLLTGPNMGGKSTLLRATCLAVILAQLGCHVPCDECVLSPADVIFTRLGATDRIMSGESTFFVECSETASVLRHATQHSLVLLDELGRGTSTFDGYAIAYAVLRHLVESVCCRLLFATHYHPLTKEFASHPRVSLQHMACALNPNTHSSFNGQNTLVFLYKLASGPSPESYGLQVALMACIPKQVVEVASRASRRIKVKIGDNFKSSEGRSKFSTLHEEWLKTLLAVSKIGGSCLDEDASDTLLCLWHEMKSFYGIC